MRGWLLTIVALVGIGAAGVAPSAALSPGYMAIASSGASGVQAGHTGYGPGWIALTFDTSGQPHGPITGYLFHDGEAGAAGNDHFDVWSYYTQPAASVNTPFAGGYAFGHFNGCTWSYLDMNGKELYYEGGHNTGGCTPPSYGTAQIFCTAHSSDGYCNDGTSVDGEPEAGVWKNTAAHVATINAGGCDVYGNVGANAIYSGGAAAPANFISHVDSGTVQVRYVIKTDDWVMANLVSGGPDLPYGLQWGFYPRGCLT